MKRQLHIPTHHANGEPTHWPEKIIECLWDNPTIPIRDFTRPRLVDNPCFDLIGIGRNEYKPKFHHIVPADFACDPGDDIEFLAVTPRGEKFPFAPLVKCTAANPISINRKEDRNGWFIGVSLLNLKTKTLRSEAFKEFMSNEGFNSYDEFCEANPVPKYRKLIYWTDERY